MIRLMSQLRNLITKEWIPTFVGMTDNNSVVIPLKKGIHLMQIEMRLMFKNITKIPFLFLIDVNIIT